MPSFTFSKSSSISQFDDLAFDMYQDPEVAHIIRLLDQKKQDVVQQENFEEAKKLKQAIADLQKVGERLARYDVEKKCAIEKEDYDLAKKKKELMDEYRMSVYQQLEVHNLLDVACAYSKTWCYREDALLAVHNKLLEVTSTAPKDELRNMIRAAVLLVKKALLDKVSSVSHFPLKKVASVFHASLKLLRLMLSQVIPGLGLGRAEVTHCLEQTFPNLLTRTGDSPNRLHAAAITLIQVLYSKEIAVLKDVRALQIIPVELVKPFKSNFPSRLAQSRAELLEKLLVELGIEKSGFTLENVITVKGQKLPF
ncbi:hypothetical protein GOODEAATRI_001589 [Goodea atripinnis]|uniref:UVR domain-containing protein n=1 Tax=Goodea atripinnis TaxID=208336 RepID=A0ABV0PV74_9TELE